MPLLGRLNFPSNSIRVLHPSGWLCTCVEKDDSLPSVCSTYYVLGSHAVWYLMQIETHRFKTAYRLFRLSRHPFSTRSVERGGLPAPYLFLFDLPFCATYFSLLRREGMELPYLYLMFLFCLLFKCRSNVASKGEGGISITIPVLLLSTLNRKQ